MNRPIALLLLLAAWSHAPAVPGAAAATQAPTVSAPVGSERMDLPITAATRRDVISGVAREVEKGYVFADKARRMAALLRERERKGAFDGIDSASVLCRALTQTLRSVVPDEHLKVDYSVRPRPMPGASTSAPDTAAVRRQRRQSLQENGGFARVERMRGNVGYLDLRRFDAPANAGETAAAAMAFLANTEAMIIDLRENGGGHGEMVNLLMTYFLPGEPVHLRDISDREQTVQAWTLPYVPGRRYERPLFVLVGPKTFSAAEAFAYGLKNLKRARVIGTRTRGGAHPTSVRQVHEHFAVFVPHARVVDVATKTDWEGTGVQPDTEIRADLALAAAHYEALVAMRAAPENAGDEGLDELIHAAELELLRLRQASK